MVATSGFLTAVECTKSIFGRGSALDPAGGAYSAPPDSLAGFKGSYFWSIPIGLLTKLPYALATFSSLCELTIMRLSFLLEQLISLPDMGL